MSSFLDKLFRHECTGIYVGPDVIIAVATSNMIREYKVETVSAEISREYENRSPDYDNVSMVRDLLEKLVQTNMISGTVQVALDDRYVRFFVIPLTEKPGINEVDNILRWHVEKTLNNLDGYNYTSQLVETDSGYRLYGAVVKSSIITMLEEVFQRDRYAWYMADTAASYTWNTFDKQGQKGTKAHISVGKHGWTLIACDMNGVVEVIKTGRWSYDNNGCPQLRNGMIEVHRILTVFTEQQPHAEPESIYIDTPGYSQILDVAKELFGEVQVVDKAQLIPQELFSNIPDEYLYETSVAFKASLLR